MDFILIKRTMQVFYEIQLFVLLLNCSFFWYNIFPFSSMYFHCVFRHMLEKLVSEIKPGPPRGKLYLKSLVVKKWSSVRIGWLYGLSIKIKYSVVHS